MTGRKLRRDAVYSYCPPWIHPHGLGWPTMLLHPGSSQFYHWMSWIQGGLSTDVLPLSQLPNFPLCQLPFCISKYRFFFFFWGNMKTLLFDKHYPRCEGYQGKQKSNFSHRYYLPACCNILSNKYPSFQKLAKIKTCHLPPYSINTRSHLPDSSSGCSSNCLMSNCHSHMV